MSLIIFIKPDINTGEMGESRATEQLHKKNNVSIALITESVKYVTYISFDEETAMPSTSALRSNFLQKVLQMLAT